MLHRVMLILLSSRITDLTHNDSPFRAIVSHCGNLLPHVRAEVHDLCTPNPLCPPTRPPQNQAVPAQRHPQFAPAAERARKALIACRRMHFSQESSILCLKALQNPRGFQGKKFGPAASSVLGQCRRTPKAEVCPSLGCTELLSRLC